MARGSLQLRGARQLEAKLTRLLADADRIRGEVARDWATDTVDTAKGLVPVDTGRLRGAIEARVDADSATETGQVGVWESGVHYSQFVENGTSRQDAQPFLEPAARLHDKELPRYARDAFNRRDR